MALQMSRVVWREYSDPARQAQPAKVLRPKPPSYADSGTAVCAKPPLHFIEILVQTEMKERYIRMQSAASEFPPWKMQIWLWDIHDLQFWKVNLDIVQIFYLLFAHVLDNCFLLRMFSWSIISFILLTVRIHTQWNHQLMFVMIRDGLFNSTPPHVGIHLRPLSGVNGVFFTARSKVFEDTRPDECTAASTVASDWFAVVVFFFSLIVFVSLYFVRFF